MASPPPTATVAAAASPPAAQSVEDHTTHEKLVAKLKADGCVFQLKEHVAVFLRYLFVVFTSEQAAQVRGSRLSQGSKAMLLRSKGVFTLVVMPADRKLDLKKVKTVLDTKSLSFATEAEVKQLTGCLPVPPFGSLWGVKTYMDENLRLEKEIEFNCGLRTRSVHMFQADYERIEKPTVVQVTEPQQ